MWKLVPSRFNQLSQLSSLKKLAPCHPMKLIFGLFFSFFLVFLNEDALAEYSFSRHPTTEQGWKSLPPYCKVKVLNIQAEVPTWHSALGPVFIHIHHYCAGLNFMNNYYKSRTKEDKKFSLESVVGEVSYMIDKTDDDEKMRPTFYVARGKALLLLGRTPEGINDMMKAIRLNPQTTEAYIALVRHFNDVHLKEDALRFATDGLRYLPNSKALQRIYDEIGGKRPYPEPHEKKEETSPQASENSAQVEADLSAISNAPTGAPNDPEDSQAAKEPLPDNSSGSTAIGTPSNPWCRFCTDSDIKPK